jgi:hypothetical protein
MLRLREVMKLIIFKTIHINADLSSIRNFTIGDVFSEICSNIALFVTSGNGGNWVVGLNNLSYFRLYLRSDQIKTYSSFVWIAEQ